MPGRRRSTARSRATDPRTGRPSPWGGRNPYGHPSQPPSTFLAHVPESCRSDTRTDQPPGPSLRSPSQRSGVTPALTPEPPRRFCHPLGRRLMSASARPARSRLPQGDDSLSFPEDVAGAAIRREARPTGRPGEKDAGHPTPPSVGWTRVESRTSHVARPSFSAPDGFHGKERASDPRSERDPRRFCGDRGLASVAFSKERPNYDADAPLLHSFWEKKGFRLREAGRPGAGERVPRALSTAKVQVAGVKRCRCRMRCGAG